ncbi:MAG TPA: SAM-dependent chlorinase/fluorinase [Armatimonadota bacterium]
MPGPVVALLTDFGLSDAYVGILHGVLARLAPEAKVIDLCHGVTPGDLREGAHLLGSALGYLPSQTVFLAVVDPGVGTDRRVLALEADRGRFVAPDNGLMAEVLEAGQVRSLVSVERPDLYLGGASRTFHGRDVMAPVAAALARGEQLSEMGPEVADPVALPRLWAREADDAIEASVIHVDRFGNLVTNLRTEALLAWLGTSEPEVRVADVTVRGLVATYRDAPPGTLIALPGSSGRLEISVTGGSALDLLGVNPRVGLTVRRL